MNQKGISPLIATVLLIAFTVAIATIIMGWLQGTTLDTTGTVSTKTETMVGCSDASIRIEHVYVDNSTQNVSIVVLNTGYKNFTTVTGVLYATNGSYCTGSLDSLTVGATSSVLLNNSDCPDLNSSSFSKAIVNTECGGISDKQEYESDKVSIS